MGISGYSSHFSHGFRKPERYSPSAARFWRDFFIAIPLRKCQSSKCANWSAQFRTSTLMFSDSFSLCWLAVFLKLRRLRWLNIVFISLNKFYKFSSKYSLVHRTSMKFTTEMKETSLIHFNKFVFQNLLLRQPYDTFTCALKIGIYCRRNLFNSYIRCHQE